MQMPPFPLGGTRARLAPLRSDERRWHPAYLGVRGDPTQFSLPRLPRAPRVRLPAQDRRAVTCLRSGANQAGPRIAVLGATPNGLDRRDSPLLACRNTYVHHQFDLDFGKLASPLTNMDGAYGDAHQC